MKKENSSLTDDRRAELAALEALSDDEINTTDIPELLDWSDARRGVFYRPVKQQITLRLDADVVAWFKTHAPGGRGYQTDINRALREHVQRASTCSGWKCSDPVVTSCCIYRDAAFFPRMQFPRRLTLGDKKCNTHAHSQ